MCLDKFGYHEVIDRSFLLLEMFYDFVDSHPVVKKNQALREKSDEIGTALAEFYQLAASASDDFDDQGDSP